MHENSFLLSAQHLARDIGISRSIYKKQALSSDWINIEFLILIGHKQ